MVDPNETDALVGLTETVTSETEPVTVRLALPVTPPELTSIDVLPASWPVARPVALMVATELFEELHPTPDVMSLEVPSL